MFLGGAGGGRISEAQPEPREQAIVNLRTARKARVRSDANRVTFGRMKGCFRDRPALA